MKLPAGFNTTWISSVVVGKNKFLEAQRLHQSELYIQSKDVLDNAMQCNCVVESGLVEPEDCLTLYAWNLFYIRDIDLLAEFFDSLEIENRWEYPKLFLVKLHAMARIGKVSEVVTSCTEYIDENKNPICPLVAGYSSERGMAQALLGNISTAYDDLEVAYALYQLQENVFEMGSTSNRLGMLHRGQSQYFDSLRWLNRSLSAFENLGMVLKQSMVLINIGVTHYKKGDFPASLRCLKRSHKIGLDGNWIRRQMFPNIAMGNVYRMLREFTKARQHLHTAYQQAQQLGTPREEALALEFLGDIYRDELQYTDAKRFYLRAKAVITKSAPDGDIVMEVHRRVGECHLAEGEFGLAIEELERSLAMAKKQKDRYEQGVILRVMADVNEAIGDLAQARRNIGRSVDILDDIGARYELAVSLFRSVELTLAEIDSGKSLLPPTTLLTQAWDQSTLALDLFLKIDITWWTDKSRQLVHRVSRLRATQEQLGRDRRKGKTGGYQQSQAIVHTSGLMRDLLQLTDILAGTNEPVLITGETGTGKELIARRLHQNSPRCKGDLVSVNITAIPASMFEREMFGHVRGAFSGAERDSIGFAAQADGGTLFLDEIGDLPLEAQPKLLRLLQEGSYRALGDPTERHTDLRLIAATNADLVRKVELGEFRSDLYYRLKVLELELPPVRERQEDIPLLTRHFLSEIAGRHIDLKDYFTRESLDLLDEYEWPGNVREIAMVARRAHLDLMARGRVDLHLERRSGGKLRLRGPAADSLPHLHSMVAQAGGGVFNEVEVDISPVPSDARERSRILLALEECNGRRSDAARLLGMGRTTLYRHMKKLGIQFD